MTNGWFRRENGRGLLRPCAWQGWLCIGLAGILVGLDFIRLDARSHSVSDTLRPWVLDAALIAGAVLLVAWLTRVRSRSSGGTTASSSRSG